MFFGIVILLFFVLMLFWLGDRNELFYINYFLNILFVFIVYFYFIFGFVFVGFMLYFILYFFIFKKKYYDFIIIYGVGLLDGEKVIFLLKRRIDKVVEVYYNFKNFYIKIIVSGG